MRAARLSHRDRTTARALLLEATSLHPGFHEAWFDLALVHKWSGSWADAIECNLRVVDLLGERTDEPVWWNLGIAATALRRWDVAKRAWRACGLPVPESDGELNGDYGYAAVRINPQSHPELVWGRRIDPARIQIESIPLPESGHRWGDVVLHDGEPVATREVDGMKRLVFNELERWEASTTPTVRAVVTGAAPDKIESFLVAIEEAGYACEDWTTNTTTSCPTCSTQPSQLASSADLGTDHEHLIGIAASLDSVQTLAERWERTHGGHVGDLATT